MEGWRDGGMEGWRDGGMGGMEGWMDGWMDGWMRPIAIELPWGSANPRRKKGPRGRGEEVIKTMMMMMMMASSS